MYGLLQGHVIGQGQACVQLFLPGDNFVYFNSKRSVIKL